MSFDLEAETWMTVFDPYGVFAATSRYVPPSPTFISQPIVFRNTFFGLSERRTREYDDVCASSALDPCDDFFLRPNIAPDQQFLEDALVVPTDFLTDSPYWSRFLFAWDEDTLCVVSYGSDMMTHAFELSNYAQLSFFKINGDSYQCPFNINTCLSPDGKEYSYARKGDHVNFFKAQLCGLSQLFIKTKKQFTHGIPCSCIFVDR